MGGMACSSPPSQEMPADASEPPASGESTPEAGNGEPAAPESAGPDDAGPMRYRVLTANVGNSDRVNCDAYGIKLCREVVLQALKASIEKLQPHLIAFQEMLSPKQCEGKDETNPEMICHHTKGEEPVRRIVGPKYTIVCEPRNQYECIAVHTDHGQIEGCAKGTYCTQAQTVAPGATCNQAFTASAVNITLGGVDIRVVNAHPDSKDFECRRKHLAQIFSEPPKLADGKRVLILGDFNLDPYITDPTIDTSVALWQSFVGEGKPFHYHSGIAEHDPPYATDLLRRAIDHVVSNFAKGTCVTLGAAPNTERIDGTPETTLSRLDHLTLLCELQFP